MSGCKTSAAWERRMATLPFALREAVRDGMEIGIQQIARMARNEARWNPDGTDTGRWVVTGSSRNAITGYVDGHDKSFPSFDFREEKYKHHHRSPAPDDDFTDFSADPMTITGVLTMTEQHSKHLQMYEKQGTTSGLSPLGPGEEVVITALKDHKDFLWAAIRAALK